MKEFLEALDGKWERGKGIRENLRSLSLSSRKGGAAVCVPGG